jgi:uncharacterized protein DUF6365
MSIRRVLFVGLGHLSNGDLSIAADFARQLPPGRFEVAFVTSATAAAYVRSTGLVVHPLASRNPERNLEAFDRLVDEFRPDLFVAADAYTLYYSTAWSGLSLPLLHERYDVPLASFDQYDYLAADYAVDFYGGHRTRFPRLLDECDLLIRNSPLNRPAPSEPGVIVTRMVCGGSSSQVVSRPHRDPPTIFLTNSRWEYVNVVHSPAMGQLMTAMPRILHSHLAALDRRLRVVHIGPERWDFPIDPRLEYRYAPGLPPAEFHAQLAGADLYITGNAVSVTLTQAVLAGVPCLLLDNHKMLDLGRLAASGSAPAWLTEAAPALTVAYPYRVFPWGWHDFLAPVLSDNPYLDCFLSAGVFERRRVLAALTQLLDDATVRDRLAERQAVLLKRLDELPPAGDSLEAANLGDRPARAGRIRKGAS